MKFNIGDKVRDVDGDVAVIVGCNEVSEYPYELKYDNAIWSGGNEYYRGNQLTLITPKVPLSIEDMSVEEIEEYVKKRKDVKKTFEGLCYSFIVDDSGIKIKSNFSETLENVCFNASVEELEKAIKYYKELNNEE
jgi:hypothetical protein